MVAFCRFCLTTKSCTPARSQAATIALPSCHRVAIGFSVTTCRPASAAWIVWAACIPLGVASTITSALDRASS